MTHAVNSSGGMKTVLVTGGIGSGKSLVCRMLRERGVPVYDFDLRAKSLYDEDPVLLSRVVAAMRPHVQGNSCGVDDDISCGGLLSPDGKLDRRVLSSVVFNDPRALADLEAIVHPEVLKDFEAWRDSQAGVSQTGISQAGVSQTSESYSGVSQEGVSQAGVLQIGVSPMGVPPFTGHRPALVAAESAIALEKPLFRGLFDWVILVDAPIPLRLSRAALRDGVTEETVVRRMSGQSLMNGISRGDAVTMDVDYVIENDKDEAALAAGLDNILSEILKL